MPLEYGMWQSGWVDPFLPVRDGAAMRRELAQFLPVEAEAADYGVMENQAVAA